MSRPPARRASGTEGLLPWQMKGYDRRREAPPPPSLLLLLLLLLLQLLALPARAVVYSVASTTGALASPTALFASLFSWVTLAADEAVTSTCYASAADVRAAMAAIPQWRFVNSSLTGGASDAAWRLYNFSNFRDAFAFMTEGAPVFDKNDHHPVWTNVYNTVNVSMSTDDRKCLSTFDVATALALDRIYAAVTAPSSGGSGGGGNAADSAGAAEPLTPSASAAVAVATIICTGLAVGTFRYLRQGGASVSEGGRGGGGAGGGGGGGSYGAISGH